MCFVFSILYGLVRGRILCFVCGILCGGVRDIVGILCVV